jgi:4-hydroxy 2-oxovalerate aldolase
MIPGDINDTVGALRTHWTGEIGFHAHNNMDGAVANCIRAIEQGVTWIDSTVAGMGRGPGNAKTEYLAIELETKLGRKVNLTPLLDLISKYFGPMQQKYGWGPNPYYYMAGKYGIHPTYVQTMLDDARYKSEDIFAVINHLYNIGGKHYNFSNLKEARLFYSGQATGHWDPADLVQDKTVLVLGAGPGAKKHKQALEQYIESHSPVVIALNKQTPVDQSLINVRAACHPVRLVADHEDHLNLPQPLIIPFSMIPKDVSSLYQRKKILDYGLTIEEGTFKFHHHYSVLPNGLVITYVLALIASGKAKHVYLAGFDGYDPGDKRMIEMDKVFSLYMSHENSVPLTSITPTKYRVAQASIYDICAR